MAKRLIENQDLQSLNTLAVPAKARYFLTVSAIQDLQLACEIADQKRIEILPLGEGSNSVLADQLNRLVLHVQLKGIDIIDESHEFVVIKVQAGENWHQLVEHAVQNGWCGIENLALIPGLVGAAPIQNIGAYGVELSDTCLEVEYFDLRNRQLHTLSNEQCAFGYRDSIFKNGLANQTVITSVTFKLAKNRAPVLNYLQLNDEVVKRAQASGQKVNAELVFKTVVELRQAKLPDPKEIPNAGSFFKNPVVDQAQLDQIKIDYPELVYFEYGAKFKLAAAWLIDQAGWKDKSDQGVSVHQRQALVVINPARQSSEVILRFANAIQRDVFDKFGVELEIEPRLYGI